MRIPKYFVLFIFACLVLWCGLLFNGLSDLTAQETIIKLVAKLVYLPHILLLFPLFEIYKKIENDTAIKRWFVAINIGLFLNDISWYFIIYFHFNITNISLIPFMLDLIPFFIWTVASIVFSIKILNKYVLNFRQRIPTLLILLSIDVVIISLFLSSIHYASDLGSLTTVLQILTFIAQVIIFDFILLGLIYTESVGLLMFLSGIILLISGDFFIIYSIISKTAGLYVYGELLWFLGLLFNMFGIFIIKYQGGYVVKNWVRKDNAIKGKLILWCFNMAIISFLLFFIVAYAFSIINKAEFSGLPLFIMLYSMIVIALFSYIGKYFEAPIKQIISNIEVLKLEDNKSKLHTNFSIEEFMFLQTFITDAFIHRETKEKERIELEREHARSEAALKEEQLKSETQEKFKTTIGQMIHDIKSPLSSLGVIVAEQSHVLPENTRITLRNATNRIGDITNNMMRKYEGDNATTKSEVMLVLLALLQIMSQKRFEYHDNEKVRFVTDFEFSASFLFIKINPMDFQRMVSNLINNAVEAVASRSDGVITVRMSDAQGNVVVSVSDNGPGMPRHIIDKFDKGIEVTEGKENGHGLGLTQVRQVIDSYNGNCNINVYKDSGTKVITRFPIVTAPSWIATEIKVTCDDTIIVLDDDESMHGGWNEIFESTLEKFSKIKIQHFYQGDEAISYIKSLDKEQLKDTLLLTDYELLNQNLNGLDVVQQSGIERAILVTSHASNPEIQNAVIKAGIKTLPKELTSIVPITVNKKIVKGSRHVDMVWVEDQKTFVDDMVREYYGHITVDVYYDPDSFLADLEQYPLDTRFILDTNYGAEALYMDDGFTLARKLYDKGYTKLILFAGDIIPAERIPPYLVVVYKDNMEKRKILNLL